MGSSARPSWLDVAVACWGEPSIDGTETARRRRRNPETHQLQVEYVQAWIWKFRNAEQWSIEVWHTEPLMRHTLSVVECHGPMGSAMRTAPWNTMPRYEIVLCMAAAGIPVDHELLVASSAASLSRNADLTAQWRPTSVSSTASTPDPEGDTMSTEPNEFDAVNESNESAEPAAEVTEDGAADTSTDATDKQ